MSPASFFFLGHFPFLTTLLMHNECRILLRPHATSTKEGKERQWLRENWVPTLSISLFFLSLAHLQQLLVRRCAEDTTAAIGVKMP